MHTLFIGSSLTWAYSAWQEKFGDKENQDQNKFIMTHGGFWLKSWLQAEQAFTTNGTYVCFPKQYRIRTPVNELVDCQFHGNGTLKNLSNEKITVDLSKFDQLVFTTPLLFLDLSFKHLFNSGFGLLTEDSADFFRDAKLTSGLSRATFLEIHKERFSYSYDFLATVRQIAPDLKIFIAPSVMPTEKQRQYNNVWRHLHSLEKEAVYQEHERLFDAIPMVQPPETLHDGIFTKPEYMADDLHHYNANFVQLVLKHHGI